jgi:hypothetical protein
MNEDERDAYFNTFAGYIPDAPKTGPSYAIRVGSTPLMADDTYILRQKFDAFIEEQTA